MSKFNVGDIVIGNKKASRTYSITGEGFIGKVRSIGRGTGMQIDKYNTKTGAISGCSPFSVNLSCFDLYEKIVVTHVTISKKVVEAAFIEANDSYKKLINAAVKSEWGSNTVQFPIELIKKAYADKKNVCDKWITYIEKNYPDLVKSESKIFNFSAYELELSAEEKQVFPFSISTFGNPELRIKGSEALVVINGYEANIRTSKTGKQYIEFVKK